MGTSNNYNIKKLILEMRKEYLRNQRQLKEVKDNFEFLDSKVKDISFRQDYNKDERRKELEISLIRKKTLSNLSVLRYALTHRDNKKITVITNAQNSLQQSDVDLSTLVPKKEIPVSYELNRIINFLILPQNASDYKITSENNIYYKANEIMNSCFFEHIKTPYILVDDNIKIAFNYDGIKIKTKETPIHEETTIRYIANTDSIEITPDSEFIYPDQIDIILNTPIDDKELYQYHKSILDYSPSIDKKINIIGLTETKAPQVFKVVDSKDNSHIDLKRTK